MRRGFSLVSMLAAVALIAVMAMAMYVGMGAFGGSKESPRPDKLGNSIPAVAKLKAEDEVCRSNLRQVQLALDMAKMSSDEPVASLEDTRLGQSFYACPIGHERYILDIGAGKVRCPHPGHEGY